jgi:hypothetical protein
MMTQIRKFVYQHFFILTILAVIGAVMMYAVYPEAPVYVIGFTAMGVFIALPAFLLFCWLIGLLR